MNSIRKVYYLFYLNRKVPMIRLSGKYLLKFGIQIGDRIKVEYSTNQITITKINLTDGKELAE